MTNDEARMTNQCRMTKSEWSVSSLVIRHLSFLRHSDFVIRHYRDDGGRALQCPVHHAKMDGMDFDKRLQQAIQRGQKQSDDKDQARVSRALNEDELRKLYGDYRIKFSDHIEQCL